MTMPGVEESAAHGRPRFWRAAGGLLLLCLSAAVAGCGGSPAAPTSPDPGPPIVTPAPDPVPPDPPPPPPPPELTYTRLVAFGDSLTEGKIASVAGLRQLAFASAYPGKLQTKLAARYTAQTITVANEGLGGERAEDGVKRLPGVLRAQRPDLVLLMEGVNDLNALGASGISRAANAMEDMVRMCKAQGLAVMLAGIPPQRPGGSKAGSVALVAPYNERLRQVALAKGAEFVDIAAAFGGDLSLLSSDGLHPNEAGYERIAQTFYDRIVATYERPASPAAAAAAR